MARTKKTAATEETKVKKPTMANVIKAMSADADTKFVTSGSVVVPIGTDENCVEITVKTRLSLNEKARMMQDILSYVFILNSEDEVEYCAAFKKFACDYAIVQYFSNIQMGTDIRKIHDALEQTNITSLITSVVGTEYIHELVSAADAMIEHKKQMIANRSKLDEILGRVLEIVKIFKDKTENMDLSQIMGLVQEYAPELKDDLAQFVAKQMNTLAD